MQRLSIFLLLGSFLGFASCHSGNKKTTTLSTNGNDTDVVHIFPVTSFIKGQLRAIDSMPVTPLKLTTFHGKTDSVWLKREDIRSNAAPFLTPVIDSVTMTPFFSEKSFLDQTINAFTFSYDPRTQLPPGMELTHWDVYMDPQTTTVSRLYLVKQRRLDSTSYTIQMTWIVNKSYSIVTISQGPGAKPDVSEVKMIWDFD